MKQPKTVKEAVDVLLEELSKEDLEMIKNKKKDDLGDFHFSLGMYIRNEFGLWGENEDLFYDCFGAKKGECFLGHPDMASDKIVDALWERLQGEDR